MPFTLENLWTAGFYLGVVVLIVVIVQALFYWRIIVGENSRKLIHILTALWMATWQFNLTQLEISYLCLALLFAIFVAKQHRWFNSVFGVERSTYGEVFFIGGIMFANLIFDSPMVYALAVINLGLADGLAAIIGTKYGRQQYRVFGATKSLIGMFVSFAVALVTGGLFWMFATEFYPGLLFVATHVIATSAVVSGLEFVSFKGLDNVTIPLATGLLYINILS